MKRTDKIHFRWLVGVIVLALTLSACAKGVTRHTNTLKSTPPPLGNIEYHTSVLADELFANFRHTSDRQQYRFAVAGFVPVKSLQHQVNSQHPLMLLGHQLEQGLMTEASRRGFIPQDYKITNDIIIEKTADRVLSRDTQHLKKAGLGIDFYVTGTITEQKNGAIVNARVIHVKTKDVVAAATKFFPDTLFWDKEMVTTRDGMIYRTSAK
ncbi:FlgO family outer membrane protein [Alteromonas sp. a30]|uniref:FlgO family outer membrane protein n=1 Tax=Alteromonas sp. a30 TaxID=2730917 RepID=UPI0022812351|nr:FlgO family outer membrane protein [Alteromonas sp. a30]MCY7296570.1 hypothetical protein [Alteromonas sp. a30]